jgi:dTDP-4-dehydrorhamnose 3,5-epimerase
MKLSALPLAGCHRVSMEPAADERGYFARLWCREAFAKAGIHISIEQASASFNHRAGTLRGLHFAWPPAQEGKLVRCARGRLHDVLLDLRPHSSSYLHSTAVVLDADEHNAVYLPPGVAHGFQTLVDNTEVHYMMSEAYRPGLGDGVRFDDPHFGIAWPLPVACISDRDRSYPLFDPAQHRLHFEIAQNAQKAQPTTPANHTGAADVA